MPSRSANRAIDAAVATPSTTERLPRSAASRARPRPSARPSPIVSRLRGTAGQHEIPYSGEATEGLGSTALGYPEPDHLRQPAGDQRSSSVVAEIAADNDAARNREDIFDRAADFGADRVLRQIGAEPAASKSFNEGVTERRVAARNRDRRRQLSRDLGSKCRPREHRRRGGGENFCGNLRHHFQRTGLDPFSAEQQRETVGEGETRAPRLRRAGIAPGRQAEPPPPPLSRTPCRWLP